MADPLNENTVHEVVGVYADETIARQVARRITDLGVDQGSVRIGDAAANVRSLKAEMREEASNTIVGAGNIGPFTKEMSKGITRQILPWTIGLAIAGCLLALFDWPASNLDFGERLIIAALVGAFTGSTIGFVWGGARGAMREPTGHTMAAERGVSVSVTASPALAADVVRVMREAQPIRLDLGSPEGNPIETLETEDVRPMATDRDLPN